MLLRYLFDILPPWILSLPIFDKVAGENIPLKVTVTALYKPELVFENPARWHRPAVFPIEHKCVLEYADHTENWVVLNHDHSTTEKLVKFLKYKPPYSAEDQKIHHRHGVPYIMFGNEQCALEYISYHDGKEDERA